MRADSADAAVPAVIGSDVLPGAIECFDGPNLIRHPEHRSTAGFPDLVVVKESRTRRTHSAEHTGCGSHTTMTTQRYSVTPHPVETLLTWVKSGEIAIPEIQRPFVWDATKVRNLLDSLYRGYPVGYLIAWRWICSAPPAC